MRMSLAIAVACISMIGLSAAGEASASVKRHTAITTQGLGPALQQLARERNVQFVYRSEVVGDRQTGGASGELTFEEALNKLLEGTGLTYQFLGEHAITIIPLPNATTRLEYLAAPLDAGGYDANSMADSRDVYWAANPDGAGTISLWSRFRLAQAEQQEQEPASGDAAAATSETSLAGRSDKGFLLEPVVVTAQYRQQSVQDVPIAISAYSAEVIRLLEMDDMWDVLAQTPGFSGGSGGTWLNSISVRGIRTNDFGVGGDTSVGLFKDGVYQGRQGGAVTSFFDMERAEALRGPQGFLYGRNTISGAINTITNKPNVDGVGAMTQLTMGQQDLVEAEAMVNLPINDAWAVRAAGRYVTQDGYITNHFSPGGETVADFESAAGRLSLGYGGEAVDVTFIAEYEDRQGGGAVYRATDHDGILSIFGYEEFPTGRDVNTDHPGKDDGSIFSLTALLDWDMGFATLSSITGYRSHDWDYSEDDDAMPLVLYTWLQEQDVENYSQDFRLVSNSDSRLTWIVGLSGYAEKIDAGLGSHSDEDTTCLAFFGFDCATWYGAFTTIPEGLVEYADIEGDYSGYGAFVNLTYAVTDRFELDAGVRYSYDEKDFSIGIREVESQLGPFMNFGYYSHGMVSDKQDWDDLSPRIAVRFLATDNLSLWTSYTSGYKAGGFSSFTLRLPTMEELGWTPEEIAACPWGIYCVLNPDGSAPDGTRPQEFAPETVDSYEIGIKGDALNDRMQFDLNAFYYEYEDMQLKYWDADLFNVVVENVGHVEGMGIEGSMSVRASDYFSFRLAGSWVDTEVSDVPLQICDCDGDRLSQQPEVVVTGFAAFDYPVSFGRFQANTDFRYQSRIYGALPNESHNSYDSFTSVSARVGYQFDNGWGAWVYGDNLFNELYYGGGTSGGYPFPQLVFGVSAPRSFGVIVRYGFGS